MLSKKNINVEFSDLADDSEHNDGNVLQLFSLVMDKVKAHIGNEAFNSWFGKMHFITKEGAIIKLAVPTAFLKSWISGHYGELLLTLWQRVDSSVLRVELLVRPVENSAYLATALPVAANMANPADSAPKVQTTQQHKALSIGSPLDNRYSFENFIEGASNRLALAAARTVAEAGPDHVRLNPLVLHGDVGLGKTHLLQAIAAKAQANSIHDKVVYVTAECFMWRFATAIRDNNALSLKEQLRDINLLIIDDLQFLQGKAIQNEFCHLLNMLLDSAKKIVVAADRPPSELASLDPRVRSRLQSGVTIGIDYPDCEMRFAMLQNRLRIAQASRPQLMIEEEKLLYIAKHLRGSGRDVEGVFNQILFRQSFEGELSIEKLDEVLGTLTHANDAKRVSIEDIQRIVARHYNISKQDLLSSRRIRAIVKPRQIAMYLAKNLTPRSLPEIGRRFGGRDHTTVLYAVRKVETSMEQNSNMRQELELIKRLVNEAAL